MENDDKDFSIKYTFNIINDSYVKGILNNTFIIFKTFNDLSYIVYSSKYALINCYDIDNFQKVCEIKEEIDNSKKYVNFNHFLDKRNKRDLVMSIYCVCDSLKLWNANNWECLIIINNINNDLSLGCCCFLEDKIKDEEKESIYIITSCRDNKNGSEPIKVYDLEGKKINEINNSKNVAMYIETFYDDKINKNYIFSCGMNCVKSYDFKEKDIYQQYSDKKDNELYNHAIIYKSKNIIILIASCFDGSIRLWDFHLNILLNKYNVSSTMIFECCIWKDEYLFVGGNNKLCLINLKNDKIKFFPEHKNPIIGVKKFKHKQYGNCLISQGKNYDRIILWVFDDK